MSVVSSDIEMNKWETVCQFDDIIDNVGICVLVNDKQIAIFKLSNSDKLYAIDNLDPFSNANVLSRGVVGDLQGQIVVASPIYKHHFNLVTGKCLEDESISIPVYKIRVTGKDVQITL